MFDEIDPLYNSPLGRLPGGSNEQNSHIIPDNLSAQEVLDCRVTAIPQVGSQVLIYAEGLNREKIKRWGTVVETKRDGKRCSIKIKLDLLPGERKERVVCRKPDGIILHR